MRILVTGGTGLVGRRIVSLLRERGDSVVVVSRSPDAANRLPAGTEVVVGDPAMAGPWLEAIDTVDAVVHLAGESIGGGRWTKAFKKKVLDSRVDSTRLIAERIARRPNAPVLVSTSAVGYYGMYDRNATEFVETDLPGTGFLADVCVAWEKATEPAVAAGARVAIMRLGIVVAREGGAFPKIVKPFRYYVGGVVGTGKQYVSWAHLEDVARLYLFAIDHPEATGPINVTAPEPLTNWGMSHLVADLLKRPCWLPAPAFGLRLLLGEMACLATHGQRAIPARAKAFGFTFQYELPEPAFREALGLPEM